MIHLDRPDGATVALLGLPDDTGVGLNSGRLGAREGPSAFREALARYGAAEPGGGLRWPTVYDAGDIQPADDLDTTHRRISDAAAELSGSGMLLVGIGGGHDLTFALARGVAEANGPMHGVYFDAHLDVRDQPGSGMPFRRLLETGSAKSLRVHGLDPFANSIEHARWFTSHGGHIETDARPDDPWPAGSFFASFDLDVIDQSAAPGVSAMNPRGWSPAEADAWCRAAGRCSGLRCFDIMELSPPHDEHGRTARLAARLFLSFLAGLAERAR